MSSDRARISYDPTRKWRALVAQQGRVSLEADWNEAAAIDAAAERATTLDTIGALGTPDGGYAVTTAPPASPPAADNPPGLDLIVGSGTLYLGGLRLDLDTPVDLDHQPDWLDRSTGTLWTAPAPPPASPPQAAGTELIYLLAIDQEVGAVEDPALADVALGGPDTMARLRVLQRFVGWPTQATSCTDAWNEVQTAWARTGLHLQTGHPASMRLQSSATLHVGFATDPTPPSPCQPAASGGYLGAQNQLIRVQIASVDADGVPTIVWGFDDASALYPLSAAAPDNSGQLVLTLATAPVDSYHHPVAGQAVELLRDAAALSPDQPDAPPLGYIAAGAGPVFALARGYDPTTGTVAIAADLPTGYHDANQLYLRVWQATLPAPADTPTPLTGAGATTGVTVTLHAPDGIFHPGDFWRFALRPALPDLIYPARYGLGGQPPDGPVVRACPIALVSWTDQGPPAISSCIPAFDNLVALTDRGGGCCTVKITPDDLAATPLTTLLAAHAGRGPLTVCLAAGTYVLPEPLVFDHTFTGLTLEGCGGPVTLRAPDNPGPRFLLGLIVLNGPAGVTLRDIDLVQPLVAFAPADNAFAALAETAGLRTNSTLLNEFSRDLRVAVGISAHHTAGLTIEDCGFTLPAGRPRPAANIFAAAILAGGSLPDLTLAHCTFTATPAPTTVPFYDLATDNRPAPPYQLSFGYLQVAASTTENRAPAALSTAAAIGVLHDATIEGCRFTGTTLPLLVMAQLGTIRAEHNTIADCYGGLWLISLTNTAGRVAFELLPAGDASIRTELTTVGLNMLNDGILILALGITRVLPTTVPTAGAHRSGRILAPLDQQTLAEAAQGLHTLLSRTVSQLPATVLDTVAPPPGAGQPGPPGQRPSGPAAAPTARFPAPPAPDAPAPTPGPAAAAASSPAERLVGRLLPNLSAILANLGGAAPAVPVATDTGTSPVLRLALSGNEIDAVVADSYSGLGLLVFDPTATVGSVLLTGNRIRNRCPDGQTAVIAVAADAAALTGNIIANDAPASPDLAAIAAGPTLGTCSLYFQDTGTTLRGATPPVAITGNVFLTGPILLPPTLQQRWLPVNAVTP